MTSALHEHQRRMGDALGRLVESLRELASIGMQMLAREIARELRDTDHCGWISQHKSPLTPREHCAAVRRRVALGDPNAKKRGKRHFLTRAAVDEEMRAPESPEPQDKVSTLVDRLRRSL